MQIMLCTKIDDFCPNRCFVHDILSANDRTIDDSLNIHGGPEKSNDVEAQIAMRLAMKLKEKENYNKAQKLFQHAIVLDSLNPDILSNYGEFLEEAYTDYIEADLLYTKALRICPDHFKALANYTRTSPVVDKIDSEQLNSIDATVKSRTQNCDFASIKTDKDMYLQHIYHTLALEGNTISLEGMRQILENGRSNPSLKGIEYNEVLGLDLALVYLHEELLASVDHITVEDILQLHKRVTGYVNHEEAGSFRSIQVFISRHIPPPASQLPAMMEDFVQYLKSNNTLSLNPITQAALAHCKFVYIHPFLDGNGRTGRLLMNLILMRRKYPPVIIRKDDQSTYHKLLDVADNGDVRPFTRFIANYIEDMLNSYNNASMNTCSSFDDSKIESNTFGFPNASKRRKISVDD